jgi:two-component system heavy metal sensor histidine kinase CusS
VRPQSIRVRLTLWYVAVVAVTTLALAAAGVWLARQSVTGAADATLRAQFDGVRQFIHATSSQMSHEDLVDEFHEYAELTLGQALLQVTDPAGLDLCKPTAPGWDGFLAAVGPAGPDDLPTFRSAPIGGVLYRTAAVTLNLGGRRFRAVAAVPMASAEDTMRRFELALGGLLPCVWIIAAAAGFALSRRALGPVDRMTREVQAMTVQHLNRRVDVPDGDDEIRRLAVTFNDMLARLEGAVEEMARLTGEASHELRTPVALIRATAEVALSRERSTADYRQALVDVLEHAERMTDLVGDLLLLARVDAGVEAREDTAVDLGQVAAGAAREAAAAADQRLITIGVEAGAGLEVFGTAAPLRRLCAILIDNALKYTNPGGSVQIRVARDAATVVLSVTDSGIGVPAEDRERVFDRFYRGPAARERTDGSGLGLPIARSIVARHQGTIGIGPAPGGPGSTVDVRLPALQGA